MRKVFHRAPNRLSKKPWFARLAGEKHGKAGKRFILARHNSIPGGSTNLGQQGGAKHKPTAMCHESRIKNNRESWKNEAAIRGNTDLGPWVEERISRKTLQGRAGKL